jgi:hypothetical protein
MAVTVNPKSKPVKKPGIDYISKEEVMQILDRQARKYLGMSGEEFVRRYRSGETSELDHSDVTRLSMLIPFFEQ